ncbi:MAG: DegT/DnrJ/EryC1/StrS family aminotransferase [Bacteroidales bacterium]
MEKIEMVDLRSQYRRLKSELDPAVGEVMESAAFINGPAVGHFARELAEYLETPFVIPCANGTDALQVALMALGLQPGDEVITSNFTFISTVEVLVLLGIKPVLTDVDPLTFNLDPERVRQAVTPATKAIIPVHLFGQPADMDPILDLAAEHGLFVIEDNAQSLGSWHTNSRGTRRRCGTLGHIGTTSFFPTKPLACYGDGGALMTTDPRLAEKIRMIVNHGARIKYYHDLIGVNSRLDTVQAAILRVNLRHLDESISRREQVAAYYDQHLGGHPAIRIPARSAHGTHVFHQYTLTILKGNRDKIRTGLLEAGIPSMIYYPVPLSLQKAFAFAGYREGDFPVSEDLCRRVLSLPIHTEMTEDQLDHICQTLLNLLNND